VELGLDLEKVHVDNLRRVRRDQIGTRIEHRRTRE
jgi:hypothetical protein